MSDEIPIWVDGAVQWLSGVDRRTTCRDVLELFVEGGAGGDVGNYEFVERWRQVERPLDLDSRLLKIWSHWGDEQKEVRLCLRRVDHEADSGRGSPIGATPSLKRRRNRKSGSRQALNHPEGLHPRRLAELGGFDREEFQEYQLQRLQAEEVGGYAYGEKTYATTQEAGHVRRKNGHRTCSGTGTLHSTVIEGRTKKCCSKRSSKPKVRNSENIEKLMKLILAQGATIQTQLHKLKEREVQIENIEVERHKERAEKNGRNYLLETYLDGLKEAEVPVTDEEKGTDSGVHTEAGSEPTTAGWEKPKERDTNSLRLRSTEVSSRRGRIKQSVNQDLSREKAPRSQSESRSRESEPKKPLTRTLSANITTEKCDVETPVTTATKDDDEDFVELRRVQSQVEMWEKVLKINKKLEKEEENLVKLHIQIRRIQSENIKIAKDQPGDPTSQSLQKQLEALRSDLDHNSKEIYRNFTQLIEEDEVAVKKQNHLTELINDLERTDHEHIMLAEMVSAVSSTPIALSCLPEENLGISIQVKGQEKTQPDLIPSSPPPPLPSVPPPLSPNLPPPPLPSLPPPNQPQRHESVKPKMLKISFDENIIQSDPSLVEKPKDPSPTPTRNIKGILKNRVPETFQLGDFEKVPVNYGSNISSQEPNQKLGKSTSLQEAPSFHSEGYNNPTYTQASASFTAAMENPYEHLFPNTNRREAIYHPATPPKTSAVERYHQVTTSDGLYARPAQSSSGVVVTTKAIVHNDTDSTGSSDTSGLSSMYSASPTVEEPTYVLNTLV